MAEFMKAMVRDRYGPPDVLYPEDTEKPKPADNQVLVKIRAASLNKSDLFELNPPFLIRMISRMPRKPKNRILGGDVSGTVEAVGKDVKELKPGDEVFGDCMWGLAEYGCHREERLAKKPANVTFEEAAAVPIAATTALQGLRDKGRVQKGQKVLIYGASGGVGTYAVQIAKYLGAEVTAVTSPGMAPTIAALGAGRVFDYTKEDYTKEREGYDLILAVNGYRSIRSHGRALKKGGTFVLVGSSKIIRALVLTIILGPLITRFGGRKMGFMGIAKLNKKDLNLLGEMLASNEVRSVIDSRYPLDQAVQAFRHLADGHAKGKIVVDMPGH
jgi:NADPH:quinone reductase-like Zn-dependent oxidoreductase